MYYIYLPAVCQPLLPIHKGSTTNDCLTKTQRPGSVCDITCNVLYELNIPGAKYECAVGGKWSPDVGQLYCESEKCNITPNMQL